jgi:hypothetical protein
MKAIQFLPELSTELLARYKKAAHADAKKADAEGDYERGNKRFKGINKATVKQFDNDLKKHNQQVASENWEEIVEWLAEEGKASRALCQGGKPDSQLGASQLASCKSQGLRARDGDKSHLIGHAGSKVRVTVGGKKIKGKKYGGPLPDYGTRKGQL